jgi:hypothetical protein
MFDDLCFANRTNDSMTQETRLYLSIKDDIRILKIRISHHLESLGSIEVNVVQSRRTKALRLNSDNIGGRSKNKLSSLEIHVQTS